MKLRIIIIIAFLLIGSNLFSQFLGEKITLQNYAGTWKYESANETVILKIRDTTYYDILFQDNDTCLVGTYYYIRNDSIIISNMDMFNNNGRPLKMPICCCAAKPDPMGNIFSVCLFFDDTKTGKTSSDCEIRYSLGHPAPRLTWHLVDEGDLILWENFGSDDEEYNEVMRKKKRPGWSVPNDITFVKVEESVFWNYRTIFR